ncbi:DUF2064 domain-containing protein [Neotamlana laminarinivorans]|uniref:DUF2064 domain-containing protein n=1 Tax=Neotamlana laminarinivorans TaxID=2883124 RepID=A0A9X1L3X0_9FLAO|nr:DUF2064 domain-containing protein [Tamlana laminarinivorans]MCB4797711.1 DUF2064 domain-containing protein [Tamlana laminarinivorans]
MSPEQAEKKNYLVSNKKLSETLDNNTLKKVKATGLNYFHYTEKDQIGNSFGERFTNAITDIFNLGYSQIITIGNDTPQLKVKHILQAKELVENNQPVLGPSLDGGFYLLAIGKKQFNAKQFKNFNWQTSQVFKQVFNYIQPQLKQQSIHLLPAFHDLDKLEQVKKVLAVIGITLQTLRNYLQQLIKNAQNILFVSSFYNQLHKQQYFNKGSPTF